MGHSNVVGKRFRLIEPRQRIKDATPAIVVQQDAQVWGEVPVPEAIHVVEEAEVAGQ